MKYFDPAHSRLVYISRQATPEFWDECWNDDQFRKTVTSVSPLSFVHKKTKEYLPLGASILEGGCGRGQYVYALQKWGYKSYGVDYAPETIKKIHELFPELQVQFGDVTGLSYENNFFDGYWSFGVIEHFYNGCEKILEEMHRVVKPGGYIFVTFPYMSPLRKWKARMKQYPLLSEKTDLTKFYQFALDPKKVQELALEKGLVLKELYPLDGIKGLKDEVKFLKPVLQYIYDSKFLPLKVLRQGINMVCRRFSGHSVLCVFEVKK